MSEPGKAVFLSYASQDAEVAKRICDALRQVGVEVWFDQSELVGGDAWDQKIRRQIKDCALLIPIISANTQSRTEGYFRLEWRLADQRTHLMAKGRAFLLPVVIDDTKDADAHVPDSFTEVQWTRLPGGEMNAAFCARVKKLLGGSEVGASLDDARGRRQAAPLQNKTPRWLRPVLASGAIVITVLAVTLINRRDHETAAMPPAVTAVPVAAPLTAARKLMTEAQALIDDPNFSRENYRLADELCQRALALDAADAEIWATAALISTDLISLDYDNSPQRRELARTQADRALRLDPRSIRAGLATAKNQRLVGDLPEAIRRLRELLKRAPTDRLVLRELARTEREKGNDAGVNEALARLRALPGGDSLAVAIEVKDLRNLGRAREAETLIDQLLAGSPVRPAYYEKLLLLARSWSDLEAAWLFLENIPTEYIREDAFGSMAAQIWIWSADGDRALKVLDKMPHDYLEEFGADEPKGYLAGWAHQIAGRSTAAQAEWQNALAFVETRLSANKNGLDLLFMKATLQALLGQKDAARATWKLRVELGGETQPVAPLYEARFRILLGEPEEAITLLERQWSQQALGERNWYFSLLRYAPDFAPIRDDPRVQGIITSEMAGIRARRRGQSGAQGAAGPGAPQADAKSVAVLAFANLSDEKANEYFSDGISEELLNVLAKVQGLKVSARTSAFHFKGKDTPIPEIARQLGVAYVVEGSVRKAGDKVRITAQLIKAADGFHVWSDTFTRDLKDIFAVQDEIAGLIAKSLQLRLAAGAKASVNPEAFELYMQARQAINRRDTAGYARAEELLTRAIELEPGFARAHAAMADVWILSAIMRQESGYFGQRNSPVFARIEGAIDRALALDPDSAEARTSLGFVRFLQWKPTDAERELRQAVALNPNYTLGHHWLGACLTNRGEFDEGVAEYQRAVELDPFSFRILDNYGDALNAAGRSEEALLVINRSLELQPKSEQTLQNKIRMLLALNRLAEAIVRMLPENEARHYLARLGHKAEAEEALAKASGRDRTDLLLAFERIDEWLDAVSPLDIYILGLRRLFSSPKLDPFRHDPRFQKLIATLGFTEAHARVQAWRAAHPPEKPEASK